MRCNDPQTSLDLSKNVELSQKQVEDDNKPKRQSRAAHQEQEKKERRRQKAGIFCAFACARRGPRSVGGGFVFIFFPFLNLFGVCRAFIHAGF
ncbi:hypothetical protein PN36_32335 [Candidatus Thiomargarita nelsonii]|uniref:Uncharacterized protein n=1 Tax=Candidatus Thiomargarita nelsonii TaxID=1003181 RepID=A0A4E0QKC8_9GAMM|nr:hypothetical protein PN36_32335 [Candidatus Thiomargarita nelsonii]